MPLYDFSNATGIISNPVNLNLNAYGVEFSPSGQFLYATDQLSGSIWQYDLTATPVAASKTQIDVGSFFNKSAMQLGPDGKIYVGVNGQIFLAVINAPDVIFPGCNYVDNGFSLLTGTTNSNAGGLPNFAKVYNTTGGGFSVTSVANNVLCNGGNSGSATVTPLGGSPPYTYVWNPTGQTSSTATALSAGTYTVTITDAGGCTSIDTILITEPPALSLSVTATGTCDSSGTASVSVSGGTPAYSYLWNNGGTTSQISNLTSQIYSVTITDANGCTASAVVTVSVIITTVTAGNNVTISSGQSATLTASGGGTYLWSTGEIGATIVVSPTVTTMYCVTDASGCSDTACVTVKVEQVDCSNSDDYFLPNAFSPNGDGDNDFLRILFTNLSCVDNLKIVVYSRWGERVFESKDVNFRWDGAYKNKLLNTAVFTYYLEIHFKDGSEAVRKGNISLLR